MRYTSKGAVIDWLSISPSNTVNAVVDWLKPAVTTGLHRSGFTNVLMLTGTPLAPLTVPSNWHVILANGDLPSNLVSSVSLNSLGAATVATNNYKLTLKVTPATGKFTGSFVHPVTSKPVNFNGLFLQAPENDAGGFFLGPATSGAITIMPQ